MEAVYRFVRIGSATDWEMVYVLLPERRRPQPEGFWVRRDEEGLHAAEISALRQMPMPPSKVDDQRLEVRLADGRRLELEKTAEWERYSALAELGKMARNVARRI
ncbi:hypothetical protein RZS08_48640, partial [Arthrospira platensis SPKY1]|nr:hypothetical protein [Arthrospira platensis SPKY1]